MISNEMVEKAVISYYYDEQTFRNASIERPGEIKYELEAMRAALSAVLPLIVEKCAEVAEIPVVKGTILRATFEESQPFVLAAWKCGVEDCGRDVAGAIRSLARP